VLGRIETVSDLMAALSFYDPEDKVVVSVFMKDHWAREAIASEVVVRPDERCITIEASVYDSDFCDAGDV